MQRYFDAMRTEIEAEGGTVEKFIGDAVMAVFGVPNAHEDDPSRALRAADAMQRRLEEVNDDLGRTQDVVLRMRIGVNTGEVLAATSPDPGDAMVTGEAVNVAARLQTSAEPGETLVSQRTAHAARGFTFDEQGALDLRGKREPVRAFRLAGVVGGPTRGAPYLVAPMVGRSSELDVLQRTYTRAVEEQRPHVVTVFGDAGVGKSRLVREFLDGVQDRDPAPLLLRGRCLPYGDGVTYWPLAEMLKDYVGIKDTDTAAEARGKITDVIEGLSPTPEGQQSPAAFLAYTVGVEDPTAPTRRMDPQEARRQVHQAWRTFLGALAAHGPVVLVVEDIHWADPALLDLLEELGERAIGPLLFVYPSRPDLVATRPGWGGGLRNAVAVSLDPLPPAEAEQLVHLLLTIDDLPHSLHLRILERAEGNPFFLEEILRRLIDGGMVVRDDDRWRASPGIESVELPDSVQGVLASRIDLLDPDDKRALQAAAVVGRAFWTGPLQLLTLGTEDRRLDTGLEESLRRLEEREMVSLRIGSSFAGQTEYIFKHILTRDVAYESIPRRSRGPAHAQVGRWLERVAGERAGEFGELLAYHYGTAVVLSEQSGLEVDEALRASALQWLLRASDDARRKFVLSKAERLAQDAIDLARTDVEQCDALTALAEAYMTEIRGDLAWQYYVRAATVADDSPDIPDLRAARLISQAVALPIRWPGSMHMIVPEPEVRALVDRGLELAGTADSRERASLLATSASWPFAYPGESDDTIESYAASGLQAAEIALRLGDYDLACGCYDSASAVYSAHGDYRSSQELWQRRWELRDKVTDDLEIVDIYGMGAWHAWEMGDYEAAVRYSDALHGRTEHGGANHAPGLGWRGAVPPRTFRRGRADVRDLARGARHPARRPTELHEPPVRGCRHRARAPRRAARGRPDHRDRQRHPRLRRAGLRLADPARTPARRQRTRPPDARQPAGVLADPRICRVGDPL